ncbi:hypothetical protein [Ferruginibacter sp. SUN106]|uniref:hypothetical protein n=1 Tax=Ferruginibacter sp. SUN106 TaxID=2978348 RepID=UPI003D36F940
MPDLPETFTQYGLFGVENKNAAAANDTTNSRIEKEFNSFKGLVKKIKDNSIQIIFMNDKADLDTMIVDLKREGLKHTIN